MSCLIFLTAPVKRKVWSTMILRFFFSASSSKLLRLLDVRREGLFDEDVLAVHEGHLGQLEVRQDGRDDGYRIDLGRGDHLAAVRRDFRPREEPLGLLQGLLD